jgi:hypothetical protein
MGDDTLSGHGAGVLWFFIFSILQNPGFDMIFWEMNFEW